MKLTLTQIEMLIILLQAPEKLDTFSAGLRHITLADLEAEQAKLHKEAR